jgi:hypothetical protein
MPVREIGYSSKRRRMVPLPKLRPYWRRSPGPKRSGLVVLILNTAAGNLIPCPFRAVFPTVLLWSSVGVTACPLPSHHRGEPSNDGPCILRSTFYAVVPRLMYRGTFLLLRRPVEVC